MDDAGIYARQFEELDRAVQIGLASGRVISVSFPEAVPEDAATDHQLLDRVAAYLGGDEDHFEDVPIALTVPTDHRAVLDAVGNVPYGETVHVDRIARIAGLDGDDEGDLATVEAALSENPIPLFVPDHRVEGPGATPRDVARRLREIESRAA